MVSSLTLIISNIILALSQWGLAAIITRFGSMEELGYFSLLTAIISPIVLAFSFGARQQALIDTSHAYPSDHYLGARSTVNLFLIAAFIILSFFLEHSALWIALAAIKLTEQTLDVIFALHLRNNNPGSAALYNIARSALSFLPFLTGYLLFGALSSAVILQLVGLSLLTTLAKGYRFVSINSAMSIARKGWPMAAALTVQLLIVNAPKYAASLHNDIEAIGLYTALSYFVVAGSIPLNAFTAILIVKLSKMGYGRHFFVALSKPLVLIWIASAIAIALPEDLYSDVFGIVYGSEAKVDATSIYLIIFIASIDFTNNLLYGALTALSDFKIQFKINALSAITAFFISYFFFYITETPSNTLLSAWLAALLVQTFLISLALLKKKKGTRH